MNNTSSIDTWLDTATQQLAEALVPSARLDAEVILAHTLKKPRTWLHAHGDEPLEPRQHEIADARLSLRLDRVPIAYIVGYKDFYGRKFHVTAATLVPRPESEAMIEILMDILPPEAPLDDSLSIRIIDVGTGSGILGITAKLERPHAKVDLLDISHQALGVAEKNATLHEVDVATIKSNLLGDYNFKADIILANLPYVDQTWDTPPELQHEPQDALYASDSGLSLIKKLLQSAGTHLTPSGVIILEADRRQHEAIEAFADSLGYKKRAQKGLAIAFQRQN